MIIPRYIQANEKKGESEKGAVYLVCMTFLLISFFFACINKMKIRIGKFLWMKVFPGIREKRDEYPNYVIGFPFVFKKILPIGVCVPYFVFKS